MKFEAPGPGLWEQDPAHFQHPLSRWMQTVYPSAFTEGFRQGAERYGFLLEAVTLETVHGLPYARIDIVGAPEGATGPPPAPVLWLISRVHPAIRRRTRRAREVFRSRKWREDVEWWDREMKPRILERYRTLQAVDPRELDDETLVEHLRTCHREVRDATILHHRLNPVWMLPTGDFLARVDEWTDVAPEELVGLLAGSSPVSTGAVGELEALAGALGERPVELEGEPAEVLDRLRAAPDPVGSAARAYVDAVGWRVVGGYDVAAPVVLEQPALLVGAVRAVVEGAAPSLSGSSSGASVEAVRERVPRRHREAFDGLLAEARSTYRIREERCQLNDAWAYGLARRALLAAGARLADRGRLHAPDHAVDLEPDELEALLAGGNSPSADEVRERVRHRRTLTYADAPAALGGEPAGPPPFHVLPGPQARTMNAVGTMIQHCMKEPEPTGTGETEVEGVAANPGVAEGTVRRVLDPAELDRVQAGDVLVARWTTPAYNAALPLLSGIVTDRGGLLSHAAIVAREYGIPSVVGCVRATDVLRDGARVSVDGSRGTVRVLS